MMDPTDLNGDDVIELRERRGLSQDDMAAVLGISVAELAEIESSKILIGERLKQHFFMLGAIPQPRSEQPPQVVPSVQVEPPQEEPAPPFDRSDGIRRVSNSEIQTFKQCRRKWWLAWYRNLALKQPPITGPALVGSRVHRALESVYAPGGPFLERGQPALEAVIKQDAEVVKEYDSITQEQFTKESDLERVMIEGYVDWVEATGADENLEVVGAEQYVEHDLQPFAHSGGLKIIGKLDVTVRQRSNGELRFIDHKTLDNFGRVTKTMRISEQSRHYQLLHWLTHPAETRVGGVIFNMLRRVKRTARATPPFYAREEVTHNRHVMESYYDRLVAEILEINRAEVDLRGGVNHQEVVPPTVTQMCDWGCPFVNICSMFDDGSRVEEAITAQYEVVDPLAYYGLPKEEGTTE